jgi:hypothetical protein
MYNKKIFYKLKKQIIYDLCGTITQSLCVFIFFDTIYFLNVYMYHHIESPHFVIIFILKSFKYYLVSK